MNDANYDNLPPTFGQAFCNLFDEVQALGIEPQVIAALLIVPLVSDHITEAQTIVDQRLDTLRTAVRQNGARIMRLLQKLSLTLFIEYLKRLRAAKTPWQKTRWRIVRCGDDSLWVHAEESDQPDVVNIWSTLYKTYRKAHDLVVLGATVGPKVGDFFFPLWVELWRQPGLRDQTRPQRMAAALKRLNPQLQQAGLSLDGIDFATDNGYLSPTVAKAGDECGLVLTTQLRRNQQLQWLSGESMTAEAVRDHLMADCPIRYDSRAGKQGYYPPSSLRRMRRRVESSR